jgi:uncharacterized protein (DUF433 family)
MEASIWSDCPWVHSDPEIVHGEPVFKGTRQGVQQAIESVLAYEELNGFSEERAIEETLKDFRTIPGAEALRTALAFESSHENQLVR